MPGAAPTVSAGSKRKRTGEIRYYAVQTGHQPGVYTNWTDCLEQVRGFRGAKFKSFHTTEDAQMFLTGKDPSRDPSSSSYTAKFYGVRCGKVPGVYTDWTSAEEQVTGVQKPKVRAFPTRAEAEAFVASGATVANIATEVRKRSRPRVNTASLTVESSRSHHLPSINNNTSAGSISEDEGGRDVGDELERELEILLEQDHVGLPSPEAETPMYKKCASIPENHSEREATRASSPASESRVSWTVEKKPLNNPVLKIYTDGSSLSNGRAGANAGVGVWFGVRDTRNISEPLSGPRQTNQRAELTAILRAINVSPLHRHVQIFTDSQYSIKCVTVWHHAWIRNNWNTSLGLPVENRDLVEQIVKKIQERAQHGSHTDFEWVKGHTGAKDGNHYADQLAVEGAMKGRNGILNRNR